MGWVFLAVAIVTEVAATLSLRMAVRGPRLWYLPVTVGYIVAFSCLSLALGAGLALGVAYGVWAAIGVALTAVASRLFFKEPLTWVMGAGIVLIMVGVLLVEVGSGH